VVNRGRVVAGVGAGVVVLVVATVIFGGPGTGLLRKVGISPLLGHDRTELSQALDVVPAQTERLGFTDWALVRSALKVKLGDHPGQAAIEKMTSRAYDTDLSASSSIDESAAALQRYFGFSPATMLWEAYAQSSTGPTMVVRMPDDFDLDTVRHHLDDLGFTKPASDDGVWLGGIDLVAGIEQTTTHTITPELQYVAVLADQHLIVTSDSEDYAKKAVAVALGKKESLGDVDAVRAAVDPLDEPAAANVWARDFACQDLAMGQDDPATKEQGDALVARAGKISPLSGLVMALAPDRTLRISELFENDDAAKENLTARARLIVGEAPGRAGSFSDDLRLISSKTDGPTVQLTLKPRSATGYPLSSLDNGPVLFATC
jgi:hypothetical protein